MVLRECYRKVISYRDVDAIRVSRDVSVSEHEELGATARGSVGDGTKPFLFSVRLSLRTCRRIVQELGRHGHHLSPGTLYPL